MSDAADRDRPPVSTRFRKGQSGNPRGRPRKQPVARHSAFDVVIDRTLTIIQGGKPREVTIEEALQHKTYQDAIAGNRAARRDVLKMIAKREKALAAKAPQAVQVEVRNEGPDPENADEAMLILGICRQDPCWAATAGERQHLLLEPWAVEAALARRAARKLDRKDLDEARRCTHAADTVRWPEAIEP
jgi:hypothetical protein